MAAKINLEKQGVAQAALLSAMIGVLTLAIVNLGTELSEAFKTTVHNIGKAWMPGAQGIGPYSGKETLALAAWLGSWFFLHRFLKSTEWNARVVITLFLLGVAAATTLLWPPVTHWAVQVLSGTHGG